MNWNTENLMKTQPTYKVLLQMAILAEEHYPPAGDGLLEGIGFILPPDHIMWKIARERSEPAWLTQKLEQQDREFGSERNRIDWLIADLERLSSGWRPPQSVLLRAPVITPVGIATFDIDVAVLRGTIQNHPVLNNTLTGQTSPVAAFDARAFTWLRSTSRFYRIAQAPTEVPH